MSARETPSGANASDVGLAPGGVLLEQLRKGDFFDCLSLTGGGFNLILTPSNARCVCETNNRHIISLSLLLLLLLLLLCVRLRVSLSLQVVYLGQPSRTKRMLVSTLAAVRAALDVSRGERLEIYGAFARGARSLVVRRIICCYSDGASKGCVIPRSGGLGERSLSLSRASPLSARLSE